jgi:hypothetical protein
VRISLIAVLTAGALTGLALLTVALCLSDARSQAVATDASAWEVKGNFQLIPRPDQIAGDPEPVIYWLSAPVARASQYDLASPPFRAEPWVGFFVIGQVSLNDRRVAFERVDTREQYPVMVRSEPLVWRHNFCHLPAGWDHCMVRLLASGGGVIPFGVTNPRTYSHVAILRSHLWALLVFPVYGLSFCLFISPGLVASVALIRSGRLRPEAGPMAAIAMGCLIGYLAFWCFFWGPRIGQIFSVLVSLLAVAALGLLLGWQKNRRTLRMLDLAAPLLLHLFVGVMYLAILDNVDLGAGYEYQARARFLAHLLPQDNIFPRIIADRLALGLDPRTVVGEWHSSDRPPLQSGIFLSQWLWGSLGTGIAFDLYYQALGTMLQCCWVPAIWLLCRSMRLGPIPSALAICFLALNGFIMVNSLYVWPKMLGGSLAVFAFCLTCQSKDEIRSQPTRTGLLALSVAMSILSHPGTLFTVSALFVVWLLPGFMRLPHLLLTIGIVLVLLVPWQLYCLYYDPNGSKLLRWHIGGAGQSLIEDRGPLQAVVDAYARKSFGEIAGNKLANLRTLVFENGRAFYWGYPSAAAKPLGWRDWEGLRRREFHNLFFSLGPLNFGWFAGIWLLLRPINPGLRSGVIRLAAFVALNLAIWIGLMFGPGTTVLFQGSYALVLLLLAGLAICIASLPALCRNGILILQSVWFLTVWLITSPANRYGIANFFMIIVSALALLAILFVARQADNSVWRGEEARPLSG